MCNIYGELACFPLFIDILQTRLKSTSGYQLVTLQFL